MGVGGWFGVWVEQEPLGPVQHTISPRTVACRTRGALHCTVNCKALWCNGCPLSTSHPPRIDVCCHYCCDFCGRRGVPRCVWFLAWPLAKAVLLTPAKVRRGVLSAFGMPPPPFLLT